MKTEIRLLLAIVLSILILVVYQSIFVPPPQIQPTVEPAPTRNEFGKPEQETEKAEKTEKAERFTKKTTGKAQASTFTYNHWVVENNGILLDTTLFDMHLSNSLASIFSFRIPAYEERYYFDKKYMSRLLKEKYGEFKTLKGNSSGYNTIDKFQDMIDNLDNETIFNRFHSSKGKSRKHYSDIYRLKVIQDQLSEKAGYKAIELVSAISNLGLKPLELLNDSLTRNLYENEKWSTSQDVYNEGSHSGKILEMKNAIIINEDRVEVTKKVKTYENFYYFEFETEYWNRGDEPVELGAQYINIGAGIGFAEEKGYRTKTNESFVYLSENHVQRFDEKRELSFTPDWVAIESKYFACIVLPQFEIKRILFQGNDEESLKQILLGLTTHHIDAGEKKTFGTRIYYGPKKLDELRKLDEKVTRIIDFGFFAIVAKPLFDLLNIFYKITRNYGVAILILTILIKIIFYPLNKNQIKSMERMKKIQPLLNEIKTKYKNDPKKLQQEQWAIMKKHKANPLGGCLPLIIQIPVFFALYTVLINAIEMRHAKFLYIQDLSSADPYYISPILMGITMLLQQKMTPSTVDPAQQKMMMMMPIVFTVIFLNMPSGLVIYWLANNVLSIAQQVMMTRKKDEDIIKGKKSGGKK